MTDAQGSTWKVPPMSREQEYQLLTYLNKRAWSITLDYNTNRLVEFELDPLESFFLAVDVVSAEEAR